MNEEKLNDKKENTIDILVSPKKAEQKKEEPKPVSPKKASPEKAPLKKEGPAAKAAVHEKKAASETRRVYMPKGKESAKDKAEKTVRVAKESLAAKSEKTRMGSAVAAKPAKPEKSKAENKPAQKGPKKPPRPLTPEEKKLFQNDIRSTLVTALIYMAVVVGISAILSFCAIRWANDIFALVKEEVVATVTIPENATISEVSKILKEKDLIQYPAIFRAYINFKNRDADPPLAFKAGEYEIKSTLNYDQIVSMIKNRRSRSIVTITIPEGYTVDQIIELFDSYGMGTREGFLYAINEFEYDYTFIEKLNEIALSDKRKYRLEGYLFPDTYEFYTDSGEVAIVDKLLAAFEAHFEEEYYARLDEMGMNLDQVVTLASIVQKEGKFNSDFYPISGVFHNRLKSKTLKRLQSDATVQYCLSEHKEEITYADLEIDNPYNTYKIEGLPPSAISNPGWEAIQAALYPETHKHYYFVSDTDGSTVFADGEAQHLKNVAALRAAKENGTTID